MSKFTGLAAIAGIGLFLAAGAANATTVPAGTLQLSDFTGTVDYSAGTVSINPPILYTGGTGQFASDTSIQFSNMTSTFSFNTTVGNTVSYSGANALSSFFAFSGGDGDTYTFALDQSVTTQALSDSNPGVSTSLTLYLLGDLTGTGSAGDFTTATPASITLQVNTTGDSKPNMAATLSVPAVGINNGPPPVPEPASLALMGAGLAALGAARRRRKQS